MGLRRVGEGVRIGGVGVVGTSTHFSAVGTKQLIQAFLDGKFSDALALHRRLLPIYEGVFITQGCIMVKAGLELQGRGVGGLRSPMVEATAEQLIGPDRRWRRL